jgi:hypothetical protein
MELSPENLRNLPIKEQREILQAFNISYLNQTLNNNELVAQNHLEDSYKEPL